MFLNCKTWFSYRYGTFKTEDLVREAGASGTTSLALTNINNTSDIWDFVKFCNKRKINPIAGVEIRNGDTFEYLLLARNNKGLLRINNFLSFYLQQQKPFPAKPLFEADVWIIYPLKKMNPLHLLPHEKIGVLPSEINKLYRFRDKEYADKFVIRQPVTFQSKKHYNIHRLLQAVDKNTLLSKQDKTLLAAPDEMFLPVQALWNRFKEYPEVFSNTITVMESCCIEMNFDQPKTKSVFTNSKAQDKELLRKLAFEGLEYRYGKDNKEAESRVEKELNVVDHLGFNAYFLITWDIIQYARRKGFFYVGRGSGANSMIAYCLRITDVDPIELDLYFERFLNPYRATPPDFDIDFSWKDRDEVIQYVFDKYGKDHVCLLGMFSTFQRSAMTRELGKVFGLPKGEIDNLVHNPYATYQDDSFQQLIKTYSDEIVNFPNHLSIHAGGILISEEPIHQYTATELPPKGYATSQLDMHVAESIGLEKLDILSQRGLGHIKDAVQIVKENRGIHIDIHDIKKFKKDEKVNKNIKEAESIGCFYIESPAMRQLLQKLKCEDYLTLVAASSIIRPGVAQSGMMRQYIYRYNNQDKVTYLHPKMKDLLEETYGVMVYQEDVIKVAHHFAGLDMGEADILRRAMSGKYRGTKEMDRIREKFFRNCKEYGYPDDISQEVWRQIASFAGYSFSKAHSASFAVESYQSLFLKTYYPKEFMVGVINNFGGFYGTELYFTELKKTGANIYAPCVNHSIRLTSIKGDEVYVGFVHVQGLEEALVLRIENERQNSGLFTSLHDFMERTNAGLEQLNILVRVGALRFTGKNKKELLWEANFLRKKAPQAIPMAAGSLFREAPETYTLPALHHHPLDDALDELELLGFPLCNPFDYVDDDILKYPPATALKHNVGKEMTMLGYLVTQKQIRTLDGKPMFFGTFIDAQGNWLDTVHFPEFAYKYPLSGRGFYRCSGTVLEEFGTYSLNVHFMEKMGIKQRR
jgi:DNA-directed DNA polymerase III PolC